MSDTPPLDAAIAAWQAGDRRGAEKLAQRAIKTSPDALAALQILGAVAAGRHDWRAAADWFGRAATLRPDNPQLRFNQAEALRESGDAGAAIDAFRTTLALAPDHVPALVTLSRLLIATGQLDDAAALLDRAVALAPKDAKARLARGEAGLALGHPSALEDLRLAVDMAPELAYGHLAYGNALAHAGLSEEAEASLERALSLEPGLAPAHLSLGMMAMLRHEPNTALAHYEKALATLPDSAEAHALQAQALHDLRRDTDARSAADRALAADPENATARLIDAQMLRAANKTEAARDRLTDLIATNPEPHIAAEALTDLGHALDRLGDYDAAFARFSEASRQIAARAPDRVERSRLPARIAAMRALDSQWPATGNGIETDGPVPVFLVGFPRSGTTLAEQILAGHGAFVTSDEAPLIDRVLRGLDPTASNPAHGLGALEEDALAGLRETYWHEARLRFPELGAGKQLVDKQPWNLVELPFIARLFPTARVIVMLRDPRDACLSAFMQYFGLNPATLHLLTLEDAAAIYADMMDLWASWRDAPPLDAIEIRYEDLVDDFDSTVQRLLTFLDLQWTDGIREFGEAAQRRVITTPSRDAVSGAITRRAVGRWQNYGRQMAPVLPQLDRFVDLFGYAKD